MKKMGIENQVAELESRLETLAKTLPENKIALIVFSGDLDKVLAAFVGAAMMKSLMKKKNVASLDQMLDLAEEMGIRIFICEMSMDLMGFKREEMIEAVTTDPGSLTDFPAWARTSGNEILKTEQGEGVIKFYIKRKA
jgi:peroxiredoxin family protein